MPASAKATEGKPANGAKPTVKSITSSPAVKWLTDRLLLLTAAIFLLVVFFLIGFREITPFGFIEKFQGNSKLKPKIEHLAADLKSTGADESLVNSTSNRLKTILDTDNKDLQYKYLYQASLTVGGAYSTTHNPKLRGFIHLLDKFASENYPDKYKSQDFYVSCLDEECGTLSYPKEIEDIRTLIENNNLGYSKQAMLDGLYNAAIAKPDERVRKFNAYNNVRGLLKDEAKLGNEEATIISNKLEGYIIKEYEGLYSQLPTEEEIMKDVRKLWQ